MVDLLINSDFGELEEGKHRRQVEDVEAFRLADDVLHDLEGKLLEHLHLIQSEIVQMGFKVIHRA